MPETPSNAEIIATLTDALTLIEETQRRAMEKGDAAQKERVGLHVGGIQALKDYVSGNVGSEAFLSQYDPKTYGLKEAPRNAEIPTPPSSTSAT